VLELQKLTPFLMFQKGDAESAMTFYTSLFDDGEVLFVERYGPGEPGPEGTIKQGVFRVAGQQVRCMDSPPVHDFDFTASMSLFVRCGSKEEQDALWTALSEGGVPLMPLDDYGFGGPFGWTNDRFGVSWQLILS
jgi:predicted 3-demethylubiquinone-9 3-methyltransferase (glyoxalase superfamily)